MEDNFEYNNDVKGWGKNTLQSIKADADQLGIQHRSNSSSPGSSIKALRVKFSMVDGMIKRIGFGIRKHLIYVHKGVGRDTPIAKVGTTNRRAKPFVNEPLDANIENLADIVAEHTGNNIVNRIMIN